MHATDGQDPQDLLKRIDPDGTLRRAAGDRAGYIRLHEPGPLFDRDYPALLEVLAERGLLRDPAEPTLAEVREKVRAMVGYTVHVWGASENATLTPDGDFLARGAVLALLEPRKPEPRPLYVVKDGTPRPALPHEIDAVYHFMHGPEMLHAKESNCGVVDDGR